jgi:6-phosphogluconolactonase/glucosamine-6-phosphate isomerase/deaminase
MAGSRTLIGNKIESLFVSFLSEAGSDFKGIFISGGSTGPALFRSLASNNDFMHALSAVAIGQVDERVVPTDCTDSNTYWFYKDLLDQVDICLDFRPILTDEENQELHRCFSGYDVTEEPERTSMVLWKEITSLADEAASRYSKFVEDTIENSIVHLGIGTDGHTASLFPRSKSLDSPKLVDVNFDPTGKNRHIRVTLTFEALRRAREVVVVAKGFEKKEVVQRVLTTKESLPASRLLDLKTTWILDREAAALIS